MRILSVVTFYHPHWTGMTAFATRISEGLAARGHEVTVLTTRQDPALPAREMVRGVRVERLSPLAYVSPSSCGSGSTRGSTGCVMRAVKVGGGSVVAVDIATALRGRTRGRV